MAVNGIFTADASVVGDRQGDFATEILKAERGESTPIFALSAGMSTFDMSDTTTTWYEEDILYHRTAVTGNNGDPLGQSLLFEDTTWLHERSTLYVESTGEFLYIVGINGNTATVVRGFCSTPVQPINPAAGTEILVQLIGSAFEEAAERPTGHSINPHPRTNITQIQKNGYDISDTARAVAYRHGNRLLKNRQDCAAEHAIALERSLIWGRMSNSAINNKAMRTMDGFNAQIKTNRFMSPAGGLTRRTLEDYIERLFSVRVKGQPNERLTFCGNVALRALNEIAYRYGEYRIDLREKAFGIQVRRFVCVFGELDLIVHPLMNDSPVWAGEMYSYHPGVMEIGYLRKTYLKEDKEGQASDLRDATGGVYTTEMTCKLGMEQTSAIMDNITPDYYVA